MSHRIRSQGVGLPDLSFLLSPQDDQDSASPFAKTLPIFDILQKKVGLSPDMALRSIREEEEDSVSPSSPPHRSALTTRSRRPRFSLGPVEEEKVVQLQSHEGTEGLISSNPVQF